MIINKPNKYEEVQVNQDFERLTLGGHKGIIKKVEEYTSDFSKNTSLKVEVDTAKDDTQPEFFQKQYDDNTSDKKKWSAGATKYVSLKEDDDNCIKMLKGFITAVENSNPGFEYDWSKDTDQLIGKKVGLVFGLEEYQNFEGDIKTATKLTQFRSIDKIDSVTIPKVKTLDGVYVEYNKYIESKSDKSTKSAKVTSSKDEVIIDDQNLPF